MARPAEDQLQIRVQVIQLLGHMDFAKLNALAQQYRAIGAVTADGLPRLALFYATFDMLPFGEIRHERKWPAMFDVIEDWQKNAPSPAATIVLARMHLRYAWERHGADATVAPDDQKAFAEHIAVARQVLETDKAMAAIDPTWARTMGDIARAEKPGQAAPALPNASAPLVIARPMIDDKDEQNAEVQVKVQARLLFEQKKYHGLNLIAAFDRTSDARTPSGLEKLNYFYRGLEEYAGFQAPSLTDKPNERQWQAILDQVRSWIDQEPSPAAYVAMARLRVAYAWAWRGDGYASTVKLQNEAHFRENLKIAHDFLVAHKAEASIDPEWYLQMIVLIRAGAVEEKEASAVIAEALDRNRYYYPIYGAIGETLTPKWGGSWEQVEDFATFAAGNTRDKLGMGMYARVYQRVSCFFCDEMQGSKRDWHKMKQGFEDILARYPVQWNMNRYAFYACQAQDRKTAREAVQKITAVRAAAWEDDPRLYPACKSWAAG